MANFARGFNQGFSEGAQRGTRQMRFDERQDLRERAHQLKKKLTNKQLEKLSTAIQGMEQEQDQSEELFPIQKRTAENRADAAGAQATYQQERADHAPELFDAKVDSAQSRANMNDAVAALKNMQRRMTEQQLARRAAVRDQNENTPAGQSLPAPTEDPNIQKNQAQGWQTFVTNSPIGEGLAGLASGLGALGFDGAAQGVANFATPQRPNQTGPTNDQGRAYHQATLQGANQMRQRMEGAPAKSPQAAKKVYQQLQKGYRSLQQGHYNLPNEERQKMQRQYLQQMQFYSNFLPEQSQLAQQYQRIAQQAMQEGNLGTAVDATEGQRKLQGGPQQRGQAGQGGGY